MFYELLCLIWNWWRLYTFSSTRHGQQALYVAIAQFTDRGLADNQKMGI